MYNTFRNLLRGRLSHIHPAVVVITAIVIQEIIQWKAADNFELHFFRFDYEISARRRLLL
jgi:hypothetical protein